MDITNYISSGILEEYTLGVVSEQERREVECMSKIYPEISAALRAIEADLERFSGAYAVKAPNTLREKVLGEVPKHGQDPLMRAVKGDDEENSVSLVESSEENKKLPVSRKSENSTGKYWAVAAAIAALIVAGWQFTENKEKTQELQALRLEQGQVNSTLLDVQTRLAELAAGMDEAYDPSMKKIVLDAVAEGSNLQLALFWNIRTGQVKLDGSVLPELPADKQYQLWVLKDGVPVDMGVLPKSTTDQIMLASNTTGDGDAFAITIEPLGGQSAPSLDQLVVMGNIS